MRLVCIADAHGRLPDMTFPQGDVLILAGDILGDYNGSPAARFKQAYELYELDELVGTLPYSECLYVGGNHDAAAESIHSFDSKLEPLKNITYLEDNQCFFGGIWFWGAPWNNWETMAFGLSEQKMRTRWSLIPVGIDVLITHIPPFGILDTEDPREGPLGSISLLEAVRKVQPKIHIFGHIHKAAGRLETENTTFINAAVRVGLNKPLREAQIVEIDV